MTYAFKGFGAADTGCRSISVLRSRDLTGRQQTIADNACASGMKPTTAEFILWKAGLYDGFTTTVTTNTMAGPISRTVAVEPGGFPPDSDCRAADAENPTRFSCQYFPGDLRSPADQWAIKRLLEQDPVFGSGEWAWVRNNPANLLKWSTTLTGKPMSDLCAALIRRWDIISPPVTSTSSSGTVTASSVAALLGKTGVINVAPKSGVKSSASTLLGGGLTLGGGSSQVVDITPAHVPEPGMSTRLKVAIGITVAVAAFAGYKILKGRK